MLLAISLVIHVLQFYMCMIMKMSDTRENCVFCVMVFLTTLWQPIWDHNSWFMPKPHGPLPGYVSLMAFTGKLKYDGNLIFRSFKVWLLWNLAPITAAMLLWLVHFFLVISWPGHAVQQHLIIAIKFEFWIKSISVMSVCMAGCHCCPILVQGLYHYKKYNVDSNFNAK